MFHNSLRFTGDYCRDTVDYWRNTGSYAKWLVASLVPRPPRPAFVACSTKSGEGLDGFITWCVPRWRHVL